MIRRVLCEVAAGWRYPHDWNIYCHTLGLSQEVRPLEPVGARLHRALAWGWGGQDGERV